MNIFKPIKPEKVVISLRIDLGILVKIDSLANRANISRNEFIVQCIQYAIKNVDKSEK